MKVNRTCVLIDEGNLTEHVDWKVAHQAIIEAINGVIWPPNNPEGLFKIHRITTFRSPTKHKPATKSKPAVEYKPGTEYVTLKGKTATWKGKTTNFRNGVVPLRQTFRKNMERTTNWKAEKPLSLAAYFESIRESRQAKIHLYPSGEVITEILNESVGDFDFWFKSNDEFRVVVEWETGNISSSHRSINKMCLALMAGLADAAVIIVPSGMLAPHLTDRIGNIRELQPYFNLWKAVAHRVGKGLLAFIEVEQDETVNTHDLRDFIPSGSDGNSKKKSKTRSQAKKKVKKPVGNSR